MEKYLTTEILRKEHAFLDAAIKSEEVHTWKNIQKIEQLKKEKLRKKDQMLRLKLLAYKN